MTTDDQLQILNVLSLYGLVVDDGALERLDEVFAADAVLKPTLTPEWSGIEAIRDYFSNFVPAQPIPTIAHHVTNPWVDIAADGETATVRSKTLAFRADMGCISGEYRDEFVKTAAGWRIGYRAIIRRTHFSTDPLEGS